LVENLRFGRFPTPFSFEALARGLPWDPGYGSWFQNLESLGYLKMKTSSSAVAERPHGALCPSVVSLNKITRADSFIIVT